MIITWFFSLSKSANMVEMIIKSFSFILKVRTKQHSNHIWFP